MSLKKLLGIVTPPAAGSDPQAWATQVSLLDLLEEQRAGAPVVLYGSSFNTGSILIHSVLMPRDALIGIDPQALTHWNGNPYGSSSCGLVWGGGRPPRVEFSRANSFFETVLPGVGEQLVFARSFEGRAEDRRYFEIAPILSHAHDLHWTPERRAWCRFDESGDIRDVIRWTEVKGRDGYGDAVWIEIDRDVIEMQLSASNSVLVQMFDATCVPKAFGGWGGGADAFVSDTKTGLHYRSHIEGAPGSWFRGVQIIAPQRTAEEYGAYLKSLDDQPKGYESFITWDWKNKRVSEVSCSPEAIASYFEKESPLPFQTSPVFFNAAVLDKYKADPDKYTVEHRSISCRNSWHLQTYDVNAKGQVHTYIKYLGDLPHNEQIYWKAFNERPKDAISDRAFRTDFEGEWDLGVDPLRDLQALLQELDREKVAWFTLREPDLIRQVHYPLTSSTKTWGDTLTTLAKLVTEGLEKKFFEKKARELGSEGDPKWGSILWLREYLKILGVDDEVIIEIVEPLRTLQQLRTKLDAHSSGDEARAIRASLLKEHGTPQKHTANLCSRIIISVRRLEEILSPKAV